jgi:predicted Fe-S protein YdhL (DUF1289 family)
MKKLKISFRVKSPGINVCRIDSKNNTCLGCGRSIKEISYWINMNNKEKGKLLLSLKNRVNKE